MMDLPTDTATRLAGLIEGALAVEARRAWFPDGTPVTVTDAGQVMLMRFLNEARTECYLVEDDQNAEDDDRLSAGDRLFTLRERGAEPPELVIHNRDVKAWLARVLLALATKVAPDEVAGHA
jgi:hypothetical protein